MTAPGLALSLLIAAGCVLAASARLVLAADSRGRRRAPALPTAAIALLLLFNLRLDWVVSTLCGP